jgi:hypothetical protein
MSDILTPLCTHLTWDRERFADTGHVALPLADVVDWTPATLLATAAGASLMATFVSLAANAAVPVEAYTSTQTVLPGDGAAIDTIEIAPTITVAPGTPVDEVRELWHRASRQAPIMTAIACGIVFKPHIAVAEKATTDAAPVDAEC